jgi:circadian clock protein KaiC
VTSRVITNIEGLDSILMGGFIRGNVYLVEGAPGTGKTTFGLQYIYNGISYYGEPGLIITFEELPEQIYHDALNFGWDLRQQEREGRLRVICTSPDIFLEQMQEPDGLLDVLVKEINAKRIFIDSINLFENLENIGMRSVVYSFRNVLKKLGLTAVITKEITKEYAAYEIPFEEYVVDGVIKVHYHERERVYRERAIEVTKMRGSDFISGRHVFRLSERGIEIILSLANMHYVPYQVAVEKTPTGIMELDALLDGGFPAGSTFIFDTNSQANYWQLISSIIAQQIKAGACTWIFPCSLTSFNEIKQLLDLYEVDLWQVAQEGKGNFVDFFSRPVPPELKPYVHKVRGFSEEDYSKIIVEKMYKTMRNYRKWFGYIDFNVILTELGEDHVRNNLSALSSLVRTNQATAVILSNFDEMPDTLSSFMQRTASGIIKTWVENCYQYLQLIKSPTGRVSNPLIVQYVQEYPYIRLR